MQSFSDNHLISLKYNVNDEIGNQLYKKYNCQFVPHLLFVDSEGNEVDRIIGFLPPTEYLLRLNDIIYKRNTLDDFLAKYNKGNKSAKMLAAIATKYEDRNENDKAAKFYSILIKDYPDSSSEFKSVLSNLQLKALLLSDKVIATLSCISASTLETYLRI